MGILDFFKKKPDDQEVVFTGDRFETELIGNMLVQEGFHPSEWADVSGPFAGAVGMARVVVPPEEGESARRFIASLEESAQELDEETYEETDGQDEQ